MTITLGNTVLCAGQTRNATGSPVGPSNFRASDAPGIVKHDYIGADRTRPEHIRCDSGSVTFDVSRTFGSVDAAIQYACIGIRSEAVEGELKYGGRTVFEHAAVTTRSVAQVGCTVAVSYTIEG